MADSNEEVLRRSLDSVDRHRNRLLIGVAITTVVLLLAFVQGGAAVHSRNPNAFLHAVMIVLGVWMTLMTLVVVIQITVMTKRILRAIELASRK
jgi:hypothetical protein